MNSIVLSLLMTILVALPIRAKAAESPTQNYLPSHEKSSTRAKPIEPAKMRQIQEKPTTTNKITGPEIIEEAGNPSSQIQDIKQPPSGTNPAKPAIPTDTPAEPAVPGNNDSAITEGPSGALEPSADNNPGAPNNKSADTNPPPPKTADIAETPTRPEEDSQISKSSPDEKADGLNDKSPEPTTTGDENRKNSETQDKDAHGNQNEDAATKTAPSSRDNPEKGSLKKNGKAGGGKGISLPSLKSTPAGTPAAVAISAGILSILGAESENKEKPPHENTSEKISTATAAETPAHLEPLYSPGKGSPVAVLDFEGEGGQEFADLLSEALKPFLSVYNRTALKTPDYTLKSVTRVSVKKIAAATGARYILTGKISKKTETLYMVSVFLRDGTTGDIKNTDFFKVKELSDLPSVASKAANTIVEKIAE